MERLTTRCAGRAVMAWEHEERHTTQEWIDMLTDRLAAYEDTGLEPEQVKDMAENAETKCLTWFESRYGFPAGELMRVLEAKQEGRLLVLPCKAGDMVYISGHRFSAQIDEIVLDSLNGVTFNWTEYDVGPEMTELWDDGWFTIEEIGETVFLTREEAEEAIKGGGRE